MTLLELMIAMSIMLMVVGALGGLARTVQQSFEYSEGYGAATQHARVVLDRITKNVSEATANINFPGCIVVTETVNSYRYPDTLVVWRPSGTASAPTGLPLYSELVVYCPHPSYPNQLVEITAPSDTRTVPVITNESSWQTELATLKKASTSKIVVLTKLLRSCLTTSATTGTTSDYRGDVRFEMRLRPSAADWASYTAGSVTWSNLPWVQGVYGPKAGLRQTWIRMEMQLVPGADWVASDPNTAVAVPFFGSAALYYNLTHP